MGSGVQRGSVCCDFTLDQVPSCAFLTLYHLKALLHSSIFLLPLIYGQGGQWKTQAAMGSWGF